MELKFVEFVRLVSDGDEGGVLRCCEGRESSGVAGYGHLAVHLYGHVVSENSPYTQNFKNIFDLPLIWNDATLSCVSREQRKEMSVKRVVCCFVVALFLASLSASFPAHAHRTGHTHTHTHYEDDSVDLGVVIGVLAAIAGITWLVVVLTDDNKSSLALQETEPFLQNNLETSYGPETNRVRIGFTTNF